MARQQEDVKGGRTGHGMRGRGEKRERGRGGMEERRNKGTRSELEGERSRKERRGKRTGREWEGEKSGKESKGYNWRQRYGERGEERGRMVHERPVGLHISVHEEATYQQH